MPRTCQITPRLRLCEPECAKSLPRACQSMPGLRLREPECAQNAPRSGKEPSGVCPDCACASRNAQGRRQYVQKVKYNCDGRCEFLPIKDHRMNELMTYQNTIFSYSVFQEFLRDQVGLPGVVDCSIACSPHFQPVREAQAVFAQGSGGVYHRQETIFGRLGLNKLSIGGFHS